MKKLLLAGALTFLLAGCTSNEPAQEPVADDENAGSLEESSVNNPSADTSNLTAFEEYSKIAEVADLDGLEGIVETDNSGTRVILFEDESGRKTVKSVFVKKENRLKVISLDDDGLLYNGTLK
ncbi:putative periplasmic lipoprotein [Sporosarcina gallistercoris]|uniref:Lipoprotein n=1 Tax=Sporosarcina gallistercoris TaxID=2762245 RepID=A0ABR8PI01_9BACL|nr:hypothetical protein [Sporosarcina gallistercoris]MBD7907801.1 hypothetical protein [Sporosarcina gallistercoris]